MKKFVPTWRYNKSGAAMLCDNIEKLDKYENAGWKDTPDPQVWRGIPEAIDPAIPVFVDAEHVSIPTDAEGYSEYVKTTVIPIEPKRRGRPRSVNMS
jgi:hypothetical protein